MRVLHVIELLDRRILVTRSSARIIQPSLGAALAEGHDRIVLDFAGVDGMSPSFLDETLTMIEEALQQGNSDKFQLVLENPPTNLSLKFRAVGRGHDLSINESETGAWVITKAERLSSSEG